MLREAVFADYRFSMRRYVLLLAGVSFVIASGCAFLMARTMSMAALSSLTVISTVGMVSVVFLVSLFLVLLISTGPVWWILCRLNLRGWASSLVAGGLLGICALGAPVAFHSKFPDAAKFGGELPMRIMAALSFAPLGIWLAWVIWRISFIDPSPRDAKPGPST